MTIEELKKELEIIKDIMMPYYLICSDKEKDEIKLMLKENNLTQFEIVSRMAVEPGHIFVVNKKAIYDDTFKVRFVV